MFIRGPSSNPKDCGISTEKNWRQKEITMLGKLQQVGLLHQPVILQFKKLHKWKGFTRHVRCSAAL